jgi:proprotein convertase subtilisin/kexin type 2
MKLLYTKGLDMFIRHSVNLVVILLFSFLSGCGESGSTLQQVPMLEKTSFSVNETVTIGTKVGTIKVVREGSAPITVFSLSGSGSEHFQVDTSGGITVASLLDYETTPRYTLNMKATNSVGESDTVKVIIVINDMSEVVPVLDKFNVSVDENVTVGTILGTIPITSVGDSTITAIRLSGTGSSYFSVDTSGNIKVISALDYEREQRYGLTAVATNGAGNSTSVDITIEVGNIIDAVAVLRKGQFLLEENATIGRVVGHVPIVSVGDSNITSMALSGDNSRHFGINSAGNITVATTLDYDTQGIYKLQATATNSVGVSDAVDITIYVVQPLASDNDHDYIPDAIEHFLGLNTTNPDQDGDNILDGMQLTGSYGDIFADKQWHLKSLGTEVSPFEASLTIEGNDLNLAEVYRSYMGYNGGNPIVVQVVDTGVDVDHEDLVANMDLTLSRDSSTGNMGVPVELGTTYHGTMCAGIIGARALNGKGVRGVAPFVKIAGSNWLSAKSAIELEEVWIGNDPEGKIALSSNSWGSIRLADKSTWYEELMEQGTNSLRIVDGIPRGKLFVKSAGNGREDRHDAGLAYDTSNPYVITVAGIKNDHTHADYSSSGSNILVSGYSGENYNDSATIATTNSATKSAYVSEWSDAEECYVRNRDGGCGHLTWDEDSARNYTFIMNGTSAATPMVAGALALVLEACPTLGWRDVKYLIAKHATKIDSNNTSWVTNGAGLHHSVDYGYGLVNTQGMIEACKSGYTPLPTSSVTFTESFNSVNLIIPDDNGTTSATYNFTISGNRTIEWIDVTLHSNHPYAADLEIMLTSPAGTQTRLMLGNNSAGAYDMSTGFRYGSVAFMGEPSLGGWTLEVTDLVQGNSGTLQKVEFGLFGH